VWEELCAELALWGEEERERVALPYALDHLDRWPDEVERGVGGRKDVQDWMWGLANTLRSPSLEVLERLAASEGARRVRRIEMSAVGSHGDLVGRFEGLRAYTLALYGVSDGALMRALLGARWPASLRALSIYPLHGAERDDDAWIAAQLAQNASLAGLETLELEEMKLGSEGAEALAKSPHLGRLRALNLGWCEIGEAGARALARSPNMASVRSLDLSGEELGQGLAALLESPHLGGLRKLVLSKGAISLEGAEALRGVACPAALEQIELKRVYLKPPVMAALAQAPMLRAVRGLTFGSGDQSWAVARLLASEHVCGLRELELKGGQDEAVLLALAQNEALAGLEALSIESCALSERACDALARSAFAGRLHTLRLRGCGGDVVRVLERGAWGALRVVHLAQSQERLMVDDAGAVRLAACEALRGVEQLDLSTNGIGDEGADALADSLHLSALRELSLRMNPIGDAGMLALVRSARLGLLGALELSASHISDAGILALAAEPALERLEGRLVFDAGRVSDDAWRALLGSPYAREALREAIRGFLGEGRG
jgi:hypothetical protein